MEARTLSQLIEECREELDDDVAPYLWSDAVLTRHLNEAVEEACIRARLLVESGRPDICHINLEPGRADYPLHPTVYVVRRAVLASNLSDPLCRTTSAALDGQHHHWRTEAGRPEYLVCDRQAREVSVSPVPAEVDVLQLTLWRVPEAAEVMEDSEDEPVIDAIHHRKLVHWACWRALNKRDSEQRSTADADRHLALFESYFGERPTARALQQLSIDPATGTQPMWF